MRISDWSSDVCSSDLIHADFLDSDGIDRATANREAVKTGDPLVSAVRSWLKDTLAKIADQWDDWRRQQNVESDDEQTKLALETWYRSEEHTSELQSLMRISYAVFCLKTKKQHTKKKTPQ